MKALLILLGLPLAHFATPAHADRLVDDPRFSYEVLFTNPICREYRYDRAIESVSGKPLEAKPKNVFCRRGDAQASAERPDSPQTRLIQWIRDPEIQEIFMASLSLSNSAIKRELCQAVVERGVKLAFVLDQTSDLSEAQELLSCRSRLDGSSPRMITRGHQRGIGYAHVKLFIFSSASSEATKIVFGSGNVTSGVVLHHENWNFIRASTGSHFVQSHLCLREALTDHAQNKAAFNAFMSACRASIQAPQESDIQAYFVPLDGRSATDTLSRLVQQARTVLLAAHRFSFSRLRSDLANKLTSDPSAMVRVVADDDLYWAGTTGEAIGPNQPSEYRALRQLMNLGAQARYLETNHAEHLLHHNKFAVFDERTVFTGAGNFTGTAFSENLENFYVTTIPAVVRAYHVQYEHLWNTLATRPGDMPRENVLPR